MLQVYARENILLRKICVSWSHIFGGKRSAEEVRSPNWEPVPWKCLWQTICSNGIQQHVAIQLCKIRRLCTSRRTRRNGPSILIWVNTLDFYAANHHIQPCKGKASAEFKFLNTVHVKFSSVLSVCAFFQMFCNTPGNEDIFVSAENRAAEQDCICQKWHIFTSVQCTDCLTNRSHPDSVTSPYRCDGVPLFMQSSALSDCCEKHARVARQFPGSHQGGAHVIPAGNNVNEISACGTAAAHLPCSRCTDQNAGEKEPEGKLALLPMGTAGCFASLAVRIKIVLQSG